MAKGKGVFIGPFGKNYESVYSCVADACGKCKLPIFRGDKELLSEAIAKEVFQEIADCSFVVADLSQNKANVFYELALAHILRKPIIHIMDVKSEIAFYLSQTQINRYNMNENPDRITTEDGQTLSDLIQASIQVFSQPRAISNPISVAFGTTSLLKIQVPWLSGYRTTYKREECAKEVWIFHKTFYWEESHSSYQKMITDGILNGTRKYKLLIPNTNEMEKHLLSYWSWLKKQTEKSNQDLIDLRELVQIRLIEPQLFDFLPCSIVLYDPDDISATGILAEPMKFDIGTDQFDQIIRDYAPDAIPIHVELIESTFDIVLDDRQVQHYKRLFQDHFNSSKKPVWLET